MGYLKMEESLQTLSASQHLTEKGKRTFFCRSSGTSIYIWVQKHKVSEKMHHYW